MPGSVIVSGSRTPLETPRCAQEPAGRRPRRLGHPGRTQQGRPLGRPGGLRHHGPGHPGGGSRSRPTPSRRRSSARCSPDDIDLFKTNKAFASVAIQSMRDLGLAPDNVNVDGGAISTGHPVGMSGARLVLHLALELKRRGGGVGAAGLCGGGGQGDALLIRVPASSA
jgi:acetyl-CoA acetyltransferase